MRRTQYVEVVKMLVTPLVTGGYSAWRWCYLYEYSMLAVLWREGAGW